MIAKIEKKWVAVGATLAFLATSCGADLDQETDTAQLPSNNELASVDTDNNNIADIVWRNKSSGTVAIALFGTHASSSFDQRTVDIKLATPASYWNTGTNQLRFRHTSTAGFVIHDFSVSFGSGTASGDLEPYANNPFYWQYKGTPVLLAGGVGGNHNLHLGVDAANKGPSSTDTDVTGHMDKMVSVGANIIRASVDPGRALYHGWPAPYEKIGGQYDFDRPTSGTHSFWGRFDQMLSDASERDIIVQLEMWNRFDWQGSRWAASPFAPSKNIHYGEETGLKDSFNSYLNNPFAHAVPQHPEYQSKYATIRKYQEKWVDLMLSYTLKYDNVLYVMNNETEEDPAWGKYWISYIRNSAAARGKTVYLTDMFDDWFQRFSRTAHFNTVTGDPTTYSFMDISQNNQTKKSGGAEAHWADILLTRSTLSSNPRPINNTKIYGADGPKSDYHRQIEARYGDLAGQNSFWMNIIGGCASSNFHGPTAGLGLGSLAQNSVRAVRLLETKMKMWELQPRNDLLSGRGTFEVISKDTNGQSFDQRHIYGEAYLTAKPGQKYALYFTRGGQVDLNLSSYSGAAFDVTWINIDTGKSEASETISGGGSARVSAPGTGAWVAAIVRRP